MNKQTFIFASLVALALVAASKIQAEPTLVESASNRYLANPNMATLAERVMEIACAAHTADPHDPSLIRRHDAGIVISRLGGYADAPHIE